jgi:hypothetical protein
LDSIIENFRAAAQLEEARSQTSFLKDQMAAARVEADLQVWFGQYYWNIFAKILNFKAETFVSRNILDNFLYELFVTLTSWQKSSAMLLNSLKFVYFVDVEKSFGHYCKSC